MAISRSQIAIASLLRFTFYFFGALIPLTSLISTQLTNWERLFILCISIFGLLWFETSAEGTIFRPRLSYLSDISTQFSVNSQDHNSSSISESSFLSSLALISQQFQPLPQFGRPGIQAVSALDLYSEEEIGAELIPSKFYPSDHLSIAADLQVLW
jgi:hypothetical protein